MWLQSLAAEGKDAKKAEKNLVNSEKITNFAPEDSEVMSMSLMMSLILQAVCFYSGGTLSDPARHDGGLSPAVGVHNIQTMRAWRTGGGACGWTYNHQPMMAYSGGVFYLHYISNAVGEHIPPCRTMMQTSENGYTWSEPVVLFPEYPGEDGISVVMHQRVGFFTASDGRLIATGYYGVVSADGSGPNDGNGIGRVVREIKPGDGGYTLGEIFFIYFNHGHDESDTPYPCYTRSKDAGFRKACEELIADPMQRMQWVEEADRSDSLLPLKTPYKAFCSYTLDDGRAIGLWKHALTSTSTDGGRTWSEPVERAKGFVNSNAKIWGQRLSDGMYATVYNPSEFRWPLAISLSTDGLEYTTLNVIHGDVPPMRYAGQYKSYGPQYVRGIQECHDRPEDGNLWVAYSVNKEDMWVSRVCVPVRTEVLSDADDDFSRYATLADLTEWNIRSGLWAPVTLEDKGGTRWLTLTDSDPFLDAMAERIVPPSEEMTFEFDLMAEQNGHGTLQIEFLDSHGTACARIDLTAEGQMLSKGGARYGKVTDYEAGRTYHVRADISTTNRTSTVYIDGEKRATRMLFAPVKAVERIAFRTGTRRTSPTVDTPADTYTDHPEAERKDETAIYRIANVKSARTGTYSPIRETMLEYVDYFNSMEDENISQAIPNGEAAAWMEANVPLFECSDKTFEEIYYYRWWTLRKHITETPAGWGMTEFLVSRPYADKYNLISCALGHHIYESRWMKDRQYADGLIRTWYRGNEGRPMTKMMNYSSWAADAVYNRFLVTLDTAFIADMYPDLREEYGRWENSHRLPCGLYWQRDVNDGMEESISGGRKKRNARPTINSYMYGNAKALARMAAILGYDDDADTFAAKAEEIKSLVRQHLWNADDHFFETLQKDSTDGQWTENLAGVREAIGYLPWYFSMFTGSEYAEAFGQLNDDNGFSAPYGLTTAERRHPAFRTHGTGRCEWDGAIWPFATSQTLTALANYINDDPEAKAAGYDTLFYEQMRRYAECQYKRGRPYIGEYLDETTGYWLKGDQERSRYYNHSTFIDLMITGIIGLRPAEDGQISVNPLIPEGAWDYFRIEDIPYHGHRLTILYDKDGSRYHQGKGLTIVKSI